MTDAKPCEHKEFSYTGGPYDPGVDACAACGMTAVEVVEELHDEWRALRGALGVPENPPQALYRYVEAALALRARLAEAERDQKDLIGQLHASNEVIRIVGDQRDASQERERGLRAALEEIDGWAFYDEISHDEMQAIVRAALASADAPPATHCHPVIDEARVCELGTRGCVATHGRE